MQGSSTRRIRIDRCSRRTDACIGVRSRSYTESICDIVLDVDAVDKFATGFNEIWWEAFNGRGEAVQRCGQLGVVVRLGERNP